MAQANRITGKDLYATFAAVVISGDFTSFSFSEEGELVEATAGAESAKYYIPLDRVDGTADIEAFYDATSETAWDALAVNTPGTLIVGPKGTASGSPKWTWNRAIVQSKSPDIPFDGAVTYSASIQFSAERTAGTW